MTTFELQNKIAMYSTETIRDMLASSHPRYRAWAYFLRAELARRV